MKRHLLIAGLLSLFGASQAVAQQSILEQFGRRFEDQGRQILERELQNILPPGHQGPGNQEEERPQVKGSSLPSESGSGSGGRGQEFFPGDNGYEIGGGPGQLPQPESNFGQNTRTTYLPGDLPSRPVQSRDYTVIRCPANTQGRVTYTLTSSVGSYRFTMSAGQEQRFRAGPDWKFGYHDGVRQRLHNLEGGKTYMIKRKEDNLWQLYAFKSAGS